MRDIIELAKKAASSVVTVAFSVIPWDGTIRFHGFWFTVLPELYSDEIAGLKSELYGNLTAHSMPCLSGHCVPKRSLKHWHSVHLSLVAKLHAIRDDTVSKMGEWEGAAMKLGRQLAGDVWRGAHPEDKIPPPSYALRMAYSGARAIPSKADIIGSFRVHVEYVPHPLSFMAGEGLGLLPDQDLTEVAWNAADELLAGPYRMLHEAMGKELLRSVPHRWAFNKRLKMGRMVMAVSRFLSTELLGDAATVDAVGKLMGEIDGKGAGDIDWKKALALASDIARSASPLSSVKGITGAANGQ